MFNPQRLTAARRRRGLTKRELAALANLQPRSITAYEAGEFSPSAETLAELASLLDFPAKYFELEDPEVLEASAVSFRSLSRMSARRRDAALGAAIVGFDLNAWLEARFDLPAADVPDFRDMLPDEAALALRQTWGLGERPIRNVVHLLEVKGVRVFSLAEDTVDVDAYSVWKAGRPFVFLNTMKSTERSRFDAAHELGHLILHRHGGPQGQDAEREANTFASAFLIPEASARGLARPNMSMGQLLNLKKHWNVSAAALAYRLQALGLISDWNYRSLCIEMSQRGYHKNEPDSGPRERSQIWEKVFPSLRADGITKYVIAEDLNVSPSEIERLVFGLAIVGLSSESSALYPSAPRGQLRAVEE